MPPSLLSKDFLSALSRNENARVRFNFVGGHGRFCFDVYSAGSPCGWLAAGDPSYAFFPLQVFMAITFLLETCFCHDVFGLGSHESYYSELGI